MQQQQPAQSHDTSARASRTAKPRKPDLGPAPALSALRSLGGNAVISQSDDFSPKPRYEAAVTACFSINIYIKKSRNVNVKTSAGQESVRSFVRRRITPSLPSTQLSSSLSSPGRRVQHPHVEMSAGEHVLLSDHEQ